MKKKIQTERTFEPTDRPTDQRKKNTHTQTLLLEQRTNESHTKLKTNGHNEPPAYYSFSDSHSHS